MNIIISTWHNYYCSWNEKCKWGWPYDNNSECKYIPNVLNKANIYISYKQNKTNKSINKDR